MSELIQQAYGVSDLQISGLPAQLGRFDIEGKTEGLHTRSELLQMLQTLLADRFKLMLHRETKELSVDALVAGKNGPKLQPAGLEGDPGIFLHPGQSAGLVASVSITGENVTLRFVANYLSGRLRRIVVDQNWVSRETSISTPGSPWIVARFTGSRAFPAHANIDHLMTDLVSKMGLRLESRRAPVEILVIDHAEKPSEN